MEVVAVRRCEPPWQWHKMKRLIRKSELRAVTSCSTEPPLSDSTESLARLRTRIGFCDPADGLCRSRNVHHKAEKKKPCCGRVCSHRCSHTWLRCWMDYAHVHTCDGRSCTHTRRCSRQKGIMSLEGKSPLLSDSTAPQESLLVALLEKCIRNSHQVSCFNAHSLFLALHQLKNVENVTYHLSANIKNWNIMASSSLGVLFSEIIITLFT